MFNAHSKSEVLALLEMNLAQHALLVKMLKGMPDENKSAKEAEEEAMAIAYEERQAVKIYGKKVA